MAEPSEDASIPPNHSGVSLTLSGELSLPPASLDPRLTFSALKRPGDTSESGSTKERKKDDGAPQGRGYVVAPKNLENAANVENYNVFAANEDDLRFAFLPDDIQHAVDFLTAGWSTYQTLCE